MVRFSCFSSHLHNHRPKKGAQQYSRQIYSGEMHMDPARLPQDEVSKASPNSGFSNVKMEDCNLSSSTTEQLTSPTSFGCCKSEGFNTNSPVKDGKEIHQVLRLKKSQSLGSGLDRGGCSCDAYVEDALSEKFSFENPDEKDGDTVLDSFNEYAPIELYNNLGPGNKFSEPNQLHTQGHSFVENLDLQHDSLFSVGHVKQFEAHLHEDSCGHSYSEHADMGNINFSAPPTISKSCSLPSFDICLFNNGCEPSAHDFGGRSRSFENLCMKDVGKFNGQERFQISCQPNEASVDGLPKTPSSNLAENRSSCPADLVEDHILSGSQCYSREVPDQDTDEAFCHETSRCEDHPDITYDSHSLNGLVDNWRESEIGDNVQEELSLHKWNELTGKDFHMRRIEDWLSQIDIQDNRPIEEVGECSNSVPKMKDSHLIDSSAAVRPDARGSPGMEAAYNYISSLTPISTSAQMTNLGLAVIPLLGAFSGLRMLNLSGNFIVKITTGALPRGLHALNLSRNNITIIEGLRELTRLRVLDLSYNRILRIGHGLSACSSLKELYLVGNKISEVEGLHRLLKLTVLDLSFNKISTAKCLGQLAANYSSLQAINLEGNPAQRNVGDEQLKRYLLSLLPNLVYFNRHAIRTKSSKEISDRSARSGTFDRSLRSEQKRSRRGHNSASSHKSTTLSNHGKSSQSISTLIKPSRGLHGHAMLPPLGSKPSHQNLPSIGAKLVSLRSSPIRRSRSEGNFT